MGKILEYNNLGAAPADNDLLFMGDYSANPSNPVTMRLTISDLNKKRNVDAADANGLMLRDDGGNYGLFIKDGGNVGVGTNSPSYQLDAQASGDITFRIQSGASNDSIIRFDQSGTQQASIGYDDTGDLLKFNNATNFGSTQHLVINSDGNVGVGIASPAANLDIAGDFRILDSNEGIAIDASNADIHGLTTNGSASGPLHLNRAAGGDIFFMYDQKGGKIESTNRHWGIGNITGTVSDARLYVKEDDSGTNPVLKLETSRSSGDVLTVQQFTQTVGATSKNQYIVWDGTQLGIGASKVSPGDSSVNFSAGKIALGSTTFTRKFNVTDGNNIVANFNCSDSAGTRLLIRNTANAASAVQHSLIAFPNTIGSNEIANWMLGSYKDNANPDNKYFMIRYSDEVNPADSDYVFYTTTTSNQMRLDTSGNVRFKGTMEASAYYDQGGNTVGNYCRGRFIQTYSYRYFYETNNQRWTPLFSEPVDTTNNYNHDSSTTPDKSMCSKAPMAGRVTRIDVSFANTINTNGLSAFVYSGADAPAADLSSSNAAYTNTINLGSAVTEGDYTIGYNNFVEASRTHLDFAEGEFLMLAIENDTGAANATVVVTVEFNVPDNLGN